jgi:hypothetical protein
MSAKLRFLFATFLVVPDQPPVAGPSFTLGANIGIPATVQIIGGKYAPTDSYGDPLTITSVTGATNGTVTTDGTNVTSLVSSYKQLKWKCFWKASSSSGGNFSTVCIANISLAGACSKMPTLQICRISFKVWLSPNCFLRIATSR